MNISLGEPSGSHNIPDIHDCKKPHWNRTFIQKCSNMVHWGHHLTISALSLPPLNLFQGP